MNERGFFLGLQIHPLRSLRLAGYFDQFSFPTPNRGIVFPQSGHEIFVEAELSALRRLLVTPRFKRKVIAESRSAPNPSGGATVVDEEKITENLRITLDYRLSSETKLRTRVEYIRLRFVPDPADRKERGLLIYQDATVRASERLTVNVRLGIFQTDSFDSGVGEYERDLPGVLTLPVLYGRGIRWYLLASYSFHESLHLSVKYAELIRDDVKTIGSGLDELQGNRDNRISLQLEVML